jgi:hypothetical protein
VKNLPNTKRAEGKEGAIIAMLADGGDRKNGMIFTLLGCVPSMARAGTQAGTPSQAPTQAVSTMETGQPSLTASPSGWGIAPPAAK